MLELVQVFRANIVDIAEDSLVIECTGNLEKIQALVDMLRPYGILEVGRTGAVAMARGSLGDSGGPSFPEPAEGGTAQVMSV